MPSNLWNRVAKDRRNAFQDGAIAMLQCRIEVFKELYSGSRRRAKYLSLHGTPEFAAWVEW